MFGMGGSEILVILIVALLFLGPEKLPEAAKQISKGIRDLRGATREITTTIENDEQIGGAIRDLKSALRGDEPKPRPKKPKPALKAVTDGDAAAGAVAAGTIASRPTPVPGQGGQGQGQGQAKKAKTGKVPKVVLPADDDAAPAEDSATDIAVTTPIARLPLPRPATPAITVEGDQDTVLEGAGNPLVDTSADTGVEEGATIPSIVPASGTVAKGAAATPASPPSGGDDSGSSS